MKFTTTKQKTLFKGQLREQLTDEQRKMLFEQCFISIIKKAFKKYMHLGKMPKGFLDIQTALPKTPLIRQDILQIADAVFNASVRDCLPHEWHPRLFTIIFSAFGELVKHSNVYTTGYYHAGIGYVADTFISKYTRKVSEEEKEEILYDNFSIFGNIVRAYLEGEQVQIISKPSTSKK